MKREIKSREKSAENSAEKGYFRVGMYSDRAAMSSSLRGFAIGFIIAAVLNLSLLAADGAVIYKKCSACHGEKADVKYANKVPALTSISKEDRIKALQSYKDGSNNNFGMGKVMQLHAKNLSDEDMAAVSEYIDSLK